MSARRVGRMLLAAVLGTLTAAAAAAAADETSALLAQLPLPPVAATQDVIAALPQVQAARAGVALAQARGQRLALGSYEWNLKAGTSRRREATGQQFAERELAMERSMRWGGKADADRALGQAGAAAGDSGYADAWHEAVRALLRSWYDWQRERSAAAVLAQQAALAQEQLRVAALRVKAGDVPRIDQLMAQADLDRAVAAQQQAAGREQVQRMELQKYFPGIVTTLAPDGVALSPEQLQLPADLQVWQQRILEDNHEVELAEAELRMARLQGERARLEARPDPLLGVRASRERGGQETVFGVYVTIPLPGAHRDADERAALALADAAEQRLIQTRLRVEAAARRAVLQLSQHAAVWRRLADVQRAMGQVDQLAVKAYGQGEMALTQALQARRASLESALAADAARWDALEALSRLLVDAHRLWAAPEHGH